MLNLIIGIICVYAVIHVIYLIVLGIVYLIDDWRRCRRTKH